MGTDGMSPPTSLFFFFNDTATTEIYTLSLHDALPISARRGPGQEARRVRVRFLPSRGRSRWSGEFRPRRADRKSTRLNSSHSQISYAVFCLKKKKSLQAASPCSSCQNEQEATAQSQLR